MILGLLLGCNNGGEDLQKVFLKSVVSLGSNFLDIFTSFGEMGGSALGFKADSSKKEDIGKYFKNIEKSLTTTKTTLEKIVSDMKAKGNPNASKTEAAVTTFLNEKLNKIIEGASEAIKGADGNDLIANVADTIGAAGETDAVKSLTEGIGKIVGVVLKDKGKADAGDNKNPAADTTGNAGSSRNDGDDHADNGALALFAKKPISTADIGKVARDASKAVSAVTGADILQAMAQVDGNAAKLAINNQTLSAGTPISASDAKDATIAGGIALRAMAKNGKFSNKSGGGAGAKQQIKDAAISAITKALNTLTIEIKKTIDEGLKTVKDAMNINVNDSPVNIESNTANNK